MVRHYYDDLLVVIIKCVFVFLFFAAGPEFVHELQTTLTKPDTQVTGAMTELIQVL